VDVPGALSSGVEGVGAKYLAIGGDDQGIVLAQFVVDFEDPGRLAKRKVVSSCVPCLSWDPAAKSRAPHRGERRSTLQARSPRSQGYQRRLSSRWSSALLGEHSLPPLAHGGPA
jgi:hypothetical protein